MIKIVVNVNDVDKRVDNFLAKYFEQFTKVYVYKLIRTNKVKVNNRKPQNDTRLQLHDEVCVYVDVQTDTTKNENYTFLNSTVNLDVMYEDDNIVVIHKPVGVESQPSTSLQKESIQNQLLKYLYDQKKYDPAEENTFVPSICHRLDFNTEGIIIAAKNASTLSKMNQIFQNQKIAKTYQCLVFGEMPKKQEHLVAYHFKDMDRSIVYINKEPKVNYKEIITEYKVLNYNGKYSWLEINLVTGRTHQIRAHMAFINHPLVGEQKYRGQQFDTDTRFKYQALVCSEIKFLNIEGSLAYLSNKSFKLSKIWFSKYF